MRAEIRKVKATKTSLHVEVIRAEGEEQPSTPSMDVLDFVEDCDHMPRHERGDVQNPVQGAPLQATS